MQKSVSIYFLFLMLFATDVSAVVVVGTLKSSPTLATDTITKSDVGQIGGTANNKTMTVVSDSSINQLQISPAVDTIGSKSNQPITTNGDLTLNKVELEPVLNIKEETLEKAKTYNVSYSCGSGSGNVPSGTTILPNNNFTPAANTCTAPNGYSFAGWMVSGTSDVKSAGVAFKWEYKEPKTFTAKWSAGTYNITYNLNGGTNSSGNPATYTVTTTTITLSAPVRPNSVFVGWYSSSSFTNLVTQIVKGTTGDKTFYAKWSCIAGYVSNSDGTACVEEEKLAEPVMAEPEIYQDPLIEPDSQPQTSVGEPQVITESEIIQDGLLESDVSTDTVAISEPSTPKIAVSKADMVAGVGVGKPCWQRANTPKDYKECIRVVVGDRLPS